MTPDVLGAGNGVALRLGLYLAVFWPTVGYFVYRDASRRGLSNPLLRAFGFGFLGVVGLLAYLATRAEG